jgi:hypothetical protein
MKKTLVAIAALASVSAFAQTTVTLSGNMDVAGANVTGTMYAAKGKTFSTTVGVSSTSVINLIAVEDLGGGMKVTAKYGLDPRTLTNDGLGVTNNITATSSASNTNTPTGLSRDEAFVGIEGSFGFVKLGAANSTGLDAHSASSPLGTGIGSGYGPASNTMFNSVSSVRFSGRSVKYESPIMNGFQATYQYAPGNDEAAVTASSLLVAQNIINTRTYTEYGLKYSNGPFNAVFSQLQQASQTNMTGWYASSSAGSTSQVLYLPTTGRTYGANYKVGNTTFYYGGNNGQAHTSTTAIKVAKGQRVAVKHNMGPIDISAQYTTQKTDLVEAKVTGLRADYNLSKTAIVYMGSEKWDTGATASSSSTGTRNITSIGLRKIF